MDYNYMCAPEKYIHIPYKQISTGLINQYVEKNNLIEE